MYGPWSVIFEVKLSTRHIAQNGFYILSHSSPMYPLERLPGQKILETGTLKKWCDSVRKDQTVLLMIPVVW